MSSARNHAKRSHRSVHAKRSVINASARRMYIRQATRPQRVNFFQRIAEKFRKSNKDN